MNFRSFNKTLVLFTLFVCALTAESENASEPLFPEGFQLSTWTAIQSSEFAALESRFGQDPDEFKPEYSLNLVSCRANTDVASANQVKYILIMDLEEDIPAHTCVHFLDPQGQSVLRIPDQLDLDEVTVGSRNYSRCQLFTVNGGSRIVALSAPSGARNGTSVKPDIYNFFLWTEGEGTVPLFRYVPTESELINPDGDIEKKRYTQWIEKMTWKDMDGVSGREIVLRRLVVVQEDIVNENNQNDLVVVDKFIEDAVLAWNADLKKFDNISTSIEGNIHNKVLQAIKAATASDIFAIESPAINYIDWDQFENSSLDIRVSNRDFTGQSLGEEP